MTDYVRLAGEVIIELQRAQKKFPQFSGPHEGYAVLLEEVDELWDEIKTNGRRAAMRAEAIQIAAMAFRFVVDVTDAVDAKRSADG